jgi:hypothetical protein
MSPGFLSTSFRELLDELTQVKLGLDESAPSLGQKDYDVASEKIKAGTCGRRRSTNSKR